MRGEIAREKILESRYRFGKRRHIEGKVGYRGMKRKRMSVSESAHKDEEYGARGARSPGESGLGEEIGAPDEDCAYLALRMDTNTSRNWNSGGRAFLRGIGQRVSFDPEAPPPPSQPARKIDEKVKVSIVQFKHQFKDFY